MGIHDGHRARMKKRFLETQTDGFEDYNVLELMLFFAIPRGDVNPTAHALINKFGSLAAVMDASPEELMTVPGVGENAAAMIKLVPEAYKRYLMSKNDNGVIIHNAHEAGEYIKAFFVGETDEAFCMACLDGKNKVLNCQILFRGSVNQTPITIRNIIKTALMFNSTSVIIAHNHTSGIAVPSSADVEATKAIKEALENVDITLADHIVVADDDFVSFRDSSYIV